MTKVSACMIVRDAEPTLDDCLASIRPHVDELVIVDTGSTDKSPEIAQRYADKWERYVGCNVDPRTGQPSDLMWDFSDARNKSFSLASHEAAWWFDADDIVIGAEHLRSMTAAMPEGNSAYLVPYEYAYDGANRPICVHWRERLIKPAKDFRWNTPCHEVCTPQTPGGLQALPGGQVLIKHRAQEAASLPGAKPREVGRNLRILMAYLQRVDESDPRAMYYTGVEYARLGRFGKAREVLRRYVQLSNWDDERCLAELELARIYLHEGECQEAIRWAMQAMTTKDWPNPYWVLGQAFSRLAQEGPNSKFEYNLTRSLNWIERGWPLRDADTVLFYDPTERYTAMRMAARIYAHWGEMDAAAEACRRGLAGIPGDPELMETLKKVETIRIGKDLDTALQRLVHLEALSAPAAQAVEAIVSGKVVVGGPANDVAQPGPFDRIGSGSPVETAALPRVPEGKLDIVIVTGPAFEDWTPKTIEETGIGGSETMAWEMSRHLAKLGHRVRHYGWCKPEQEGVYGGESFCGEPVGLDPGWVAVVRETYANALYHHQPDIQVRQWAIPGHPIVVGASVLDAEHWQRMKERDGVTGCVNIEVEHSDVGKMEPFELCEEQFPDDGSPVDAGKLERIYQFARGVLGKGGRVYVHCQMGGSRSPAVAYAILRSCRGLSPADALVAINRGFASRKDVREEYGHHPVHQAYIASVEAWLAQKSTGGVHWFDSARYRDIECDALVVSRYADLVQCVGGTKAKARLLWTHDVVPANLTPAHAMRFDRVLCLSNWHKAYVAQTHPFLDPERIIVTRNGIDLSLFDPERPYCEDCGGFKGQYFGTEPSENLDPTCKSSVPPYEQVKSEADHNWIQQVPLKREPHRAVYSSSPDRGLQTALELWPLVRAEVPDAELHVFYGFDGLRKAGPGNADLADKLEATAKATPGVVLHGRVSPRELAREFMRSGVWFYPTWFSETSCITAMQAQAAGLVVVTSPIAALNETVRGGFFIDGAPGPVNMAQSFECGPCSEEYKQRMVKATVRALGIGEERATGDAFDTFGLVPLASDWSAMLQTLCSEQPMPRFYVDPAMAAVARETDEAAA